MSARRDDTKKDDRNDQIDILLSRALTQQAEPDAALQRRVLDQWKERQGMNQKKKWTAAVAAAACVLALSVSVGAASRYLNSRQVAENFGMDNMAKAFSEGDGIEINQTQSYGSYQVTLMGVASGENLGWARSEGGQQLEENKTYAIVAIERTDGVPMADGTDDNVMPEEYFLSPLIQGCNPVNFNVITMDGSYSWKVIDGVRYNIVECDNVEIFADHKLYLCVMDRTLYDRAAYDYDAATGEITPNRDYEGMNLLFDLPLDPGKADAQKVTEYLSTFELMFPDADNWTGDAAVVDETQKYELFPGDVEYIISKEWKKEIAESERIVERTPVDKAKSGGYELEYALALSDGVEISGTLYFYDEEFVDGVAVQTTYYSAAEAGMYHKQISVAEKDENGNVTIRSYVRLVPESEAE